MTESRTAHEEDDQKERRARSFDGPELSAALASVMDNNSDPAAVAEVRRGLPLTSSGSDASTGSGGGESGADEIDPLETGD